MHLGPFWLNSQLQKQALDVTFTAEAAPKDHIAANSNTSQLPAVATSWTDFKTLY